MIGRSSVAKLIVFWVTFCLDTSSTFTLRSGSKQLPFDHRAARSPGEENENGNEDYSSYRRAMLLTLGLGQPFFLGHSNALAAPSFFSRFIDQTTDGGIYVVTPEKNATGTLQRETYNFKTYGVSSEQCLLRLLPVKNPFFRQLESSLDGISSLKTALRDPDTWMRATKSVQNTVVELDKKRGQLAPAFNPDDSSLLQIEKGIRSEQLIETLRTRMVELANATRAVNETQTFFKQRECLLALADVGELLVARFPYEVPTEGKFSYLPRLQGRARVQFSFRRGKKMLGNVTIIADGYTAPITAGNFVDLSIRNFYTGLPIKQSKKRIGLGNEFEIANLPILGSFQEGFYDPLTAKPRRIPLEIIRTDKSNGVPSLSYSQGLSSLTGQQVTLETTDNSKPLLSFDIPGLVAFNHPEKQPNGGSAEFFSLQESSVLEGKRKLLDGEYAPFGYIVDGYDLFQKLKSNDVIDETIVDEYGQLNLVKVRQSSFSEVVKGSEENTP